LGTVSAVNHQWTTGHFHGGSTTACPDQSCTGTSTGGETCDLDPATDSTAACPAGCTAVPVARSATVAFRPGDTASVSAAETSPCQFAITFTTPLCRRPVDASCTGTADDAATYPSCAHSFATSSCTGTADPIAGTASCTGTANQVAAVCSDTTHTDQSACESADCSGTSCVWSPAYTPTCDLDATTDSTAACPTGCTDVAATVPACDRDGATDGTADCPAGCTVDSSASSCPPGCLFADAQTGR
jgi:hypothetical protein